MINSRPIPDLFTPGIFTPSRRVLFNGLYHLVKIRLSHPPVRAILHLEIILLERDGVVEEEMWSGYEELWEGVLGEIEVYGA